MLQIQTWFSLVKNDDDGWAALCGYTYERQLGLVLVLLPRGGHQGVSQVQAEELLEDLKRELKYRIPRLHHPENFRRFPEVFGDVCKNKTSFL